MEALALGAAEVAAVGAHLDDDLDATVAVQDVGDAYRVAFTGDRGALGPADGREVGVGEQRQDPVPSAAGVEGGVDAGPDAPPVQARQQAGCRRAVESGHQEDATEVQRFRGGEHGEVEGGLREGAVGAGVVQEGAFAAAADEHHAGRRGVLVRPHDPPVQAPSPGRVDHEVAEHVGADHTGDRHVEPEPRQHRGRVQRAAPGSYGGSLRQRQRTRLRHRVDRPREHVHDDDAQTDDVGHQPGPAPTTATVRPACDSSAAVKMSCEAAASSGVAQ